MYVCAYVRSPCAQMCLWPCAQDDSLPPGLTRGEVPGHVLTALPTMAASQPSRSRHQEPQEVRTVPFHFPGGGEEDGVSPL